MNISIKFNSTSTKSIIKNFKKGILTEFCGMCVTEPSASDMTIYFQSEQFPTESTLRELSESFQSSLVCKVEDYDAEELTLTRIEILDFNGEVVSYKFAEANVTEIKDIDVNGEDVSQDEIFESLDKIAQRKIMSKGLKKIGHLDTPNICLEMYVTEHGYLTIVEDKKKGVLLDEEHTDTEHMINNLLCYGINYYTIISFVEENESINGKSFTIDRDSLEKWTKKNIKKKHRYSNMDNYELYDQYWKEKLNDHKVSIFKPIKIKRK